MVVQNVETTTFQLNNYTVSQKGPLCLRWKYSMLRTVHSSTGQRSGMLGLGLGLTNQGLGVGLGLGIEI